MPAATPPNLYEELKKALNDFKTFLDANVNTIKPLITAIKAFAPQIVELITELITLLTKIRDQISGFNPPGAAELNKITTFTTSVSTMLTSIRTLLPNEEPAIAKIEGIVSVVGSLPSLDQIKAEITQTINVILGHLNTLKTA